GVYSVVKFAQPVTVSVDNDNNGKSVNYGLVDSTGKVVAVSENGQTYNVLESPTELENLDKASYGGGSITFSSAVTHGTVTIANDDSGATATARGGIDVLSQTAADSAITVINTAIERVSAERSKLGAYQNRLEHTI